MPEAAPFPSPKLPQDVAARLIAEWDSAYDELTRKMHRLGRIKRKTLMLRMIEIVSQISAVFATPASTNDSLWLRGGL